MVRVASLGFSTAVRVVERARAARKAVEGGGASSAAGGVSRLDRRQSRPGARRASDPRPGLADEDEEAPSPRGVSGRRLASRRRGRDRHDGGAIAGAARGIGVWKQTMRTRLPRRQAGQGRGCRGGWSSAGCGGEGLLG